jgi:hypothetical protein
MSGSPLPTLKAGSFTTTSPPPQRCNMKRQKTWNVYLNGELIDTIFYFCNVDEDEVLQDLIEHDGYDPMIVIA